MDKFESNGRKTNLERRSIIVPSQTAGGRLASRGRAPRRMRRQSAALIVELLA
jgi:hypothetical protein